MNLFSLSSEEFDKELEIFSKYLDSLGKYEFLGQLEICDIKLKKSFILRLRQVFCKHKYRLLEFTPMANYKELYCICQFCGKHHPIEGNFPRYIDFKNNLKED